MTRAGRLTPAQRAELVDRYRAGMTKADLAALFGVPLSTIRYHTIGVVRPAVAEARLQALQVALAREVPTFSNGLPLSAAQQALVRTRWQAGATAAALAATFAVSESLIQQLVANSARSPKGVQRERARQAATARATRGYPKLHPGASAVRITPARGGGCELRISRELYRRLGAPARLDLKRHGTRLLLFPGMRYGVVNRGTHGMPRITIGRPTRAALRLTTDGPFPARVVRRPAPHITVDLSAGARETGSAGSGTDH